MSVLMYVLVLVLKVVSYRLVQDSVSASTISMCKFISRIVNHISMYGNNEKMFTLQNIIFLFCLTKTFQTWIFVIK